MTREHIPSAQAATWSGIAGNMGLAVIKAGVGYMANSKSLLADGLYSASEAGSALAGLFPSKSVRDKSRAHRGRFKEHSHVARPGISVLLSVLILMGGLQLAISALGSLSGSEPEAPGKSVLLVAVAGSGCERSNFSISVQIFP